MSVGEITHCETMGVVAGGGVMKPLAGATHVAGSFNEFDECTSF